MNTMNNKECLSYVKSEAKKIGLTLREKNMTINNAKAYKFIERGNVHNTIVDNMTLIMALNRVCSGELKDWKNW